MTLFWIFILLLLIIAAFFFSMYQQSRIMGSQTMPLSADDRLRLALTLRLLEDAEKELAKAAWHNAQPGHPALSSLLMELQDLQLQARRVIRQHS
jgi:hypothetical protein